MTGILLLGLAVLGLGLLTGQAGVHLLLPASLRAARDEDPRATVGRLTHLALLPWTLGIALLLAVFAPAIPHALGWWDDHCGEHADHHPHVCLVHPRHPAHPERLVLPVLAVVLLAAYSAFRFAGLLLRSEGLASRLRAGSSEWGDAPGVRLIPDRRVLAVTAGMLDPAIYLTDAAVARLGSDGLAAVLAHERAHQGAGDTRRRALVQATAASLAPTDRAILLAALDLATERAADEAAAADVGDRLLVAETILAVERMQGTGGPALTTAGCAFADRMLSDRIEALLRPAPAPGAFTSTAGFRISSLLVACLATAPVLHHAIESLLVKLFG